MNFEAYFRERLKEFLKEQEKKGTAVFFRGFGPAQNREILSARGALSPEGVLNADGTLNLPALEEKSGETAGILMSGGFSAGVYEQLLAALRVQPELAGRGGIVIAEDNLFRSYYPAAVPLETASALYDFFRSDSAKPPKELNSFFRFYSDADSPDENHSFLAPLLPSRAEEFPVFPFFPEGAVRENADPEKGTEIPVSGKRFPAYKADLLAGKLPDDVVFTVDGRHDLSSFGLPVFAGITAAVGKPCRVRKVSRFNVTEKNSGESFLPLLRKYWGESASFRGLRFYHSPDSERETAEISQGDVIAEIYAQSEAALSGSVYHDIFITAPTGAGKSLLFQLPAIRLAESRNAVTVVVSPLIALMKDQVMQLTEERGVSSAAFINSTLTFEEREERFREIRSGEKSIVYLAPELLVSTPLDAVTGGRPLGLFVVDEAHIVTSWGKDFRADYWYLGDFLKQLRRGGMSFPVLCLTATAVFGGTEDVVGETVENLFLRDPILFLGSVRRDNIGFSIRRCNTKEVTGSLEACKVQKACSAVTEYVKANRKALVYCPFIAQVDDIYMRLDERTRGKVKKYYGSLDKEARDAAQETFRSEKCSVMVCTKAFGMGVDVKDITDVYHYAPTGSLADYVQEIGRAARAEGSNASASADYFPTDMHYVRTLNGISEMKQYQLREMLRKIGSLYRGKNSRSLFLSPDSFAYLFDGKELDNRVKNGLLLLARDLEAKYGYPVITVRPRAILTHAFGNMPNSAAAAFERDYAGEVHACEDRGGRVQVSRNRRYESDTKVFNSGRIYELDMPEIWENHFQDMSFSQFNRRFFAGELFKGPAGETFSPRIRVTASFTSPYPQAMKKLESVCETLSDIFRDFRAAGTAFTADDFKQALCARFGSAFTRLEFSTLLLDSFVADPSRSIGFRSNRDRIKFITPHKAPSGEFVYRVLNTGYIAMPAYMKQLAAQCLPDDDDVYRAFIPLGHSGTRSERMRFFSLLELLGLLSCQMEGGESLEVFVRVNDPETLDSLTDGKYSNDVLTEIRRRHRAEQETMGAFMSRELSDSQRWDVIEDYFLGREDSVRKALGISGAE